MLTLKNSSKILITTYTIIHIIIKVEGEWPFELLHGGGSSPWKSIFFLSLTRSYGLTLVALSVA